MRTFGLVLVLVTTALAACSEPGKARIDSSADSGACTMIANTAPAVAVTTGDATVPTGTGGTVVDGTYYLTAVVRTPTSSMPQLTLRQTLRISGDTIEMAVEESDKPEINGVSTFTTSGSSFSSTRVCSTEVNPAPELQYDSYTADAAHLFLYSTGIGISVTFTKQS